MMYLIAYTADVQALSLRGIELCGQDKWSEYMRVGDKGLEIILIKARVAYAKDSLASTCLIRLRLRDIIGDPEDPSYVPFIDDVGLTALAYGENRGPDDPITQIETGVGDTLHPEALPLYETVLPRTELEDGGTRFTRLCDFNRTPRNER